MLLFSISSSFAGRFAPRHLLPSVGLVAAVVSLWACGGDTRASVGTGSSAGIPLTGEVAWLPVPATEAPKAFSPLEVQFLGLQSLASANSNDLSYVSDGLALPNATPSCAAAGCSFQVGPVTTVGTSDAIFALVRPSGAATQSLYVPTASMVLNNNQLLIANKRRAATATQGQALSVSTTGLAQLSKLAGLSPDALLARGVCIAFVASSRSFETGPIPGEASALVALSGAPEGASVVYVDDGFLNVSRAGTNTNGAFLVVGPTTPPADGTGLLIDLNVQARSSALVWPNQRAVIRPGMVVTMPVLPTP